MAGEATHIRFALDMGETYHAKDLRKYISGAVYPDSRYITQINRDLTHPVDFKVENLKGSEDFNKGWFSHLICDQVQAEITKEKLPEVVDGKPDPGSEVWIKITALKILQDFDDVRKLDTAKYLPYLNYLENPQGEDLELMKKYNSIFQRVFGNPHLLLENCCEILIEFGVGHELANKVKDKVEEYNKDPKIKNFLATIYGEIVEKAKHY